MLASPSLWAYRTGSHTLETFSLLRSFAVSELAGITRGWAEQIAVDNPTLYSRRLEGLDAIASAHLFLALREYGEKPLIVDSAAGTAPFSHAFVMLAGFILDVTATRLGLNQKVVVEKWSGDLCTSQPQWSRAAQFDDLGAFERHLVERKWEAHRRPSWIPMLVAHSGRPMPSSHQLGAQLRAEAPA